MAQPRHQDSVVAGSNRTRVLPALFFVNLLLFRSVPIHATSCSAALPSARSRHSQKLLQPLKKHQRDLFRRRFEGAFLTRSSQQQRSQSSNEILERLRGGAFGNKQSNHDAKSLSKASSNQQPVPTNNSRSKAVKIGATTVTLLAIALSTIHYWDTIKLFFNREKLRATIIQTLNDVASKGNAGLLTYTIGFIFWEVCGLPTAVVETAAGMAFGFSRGLLGSFVGKTLGSIVAFTLGRTLLANLVGSKMESNASFALIEESIAENPMLSALIMRYSPFPQLIKNFALSITTPVTFPMFILAISIHGFPFSLLWAALGHDSSLRLRASEAGDTMEANVILNGLLVFVTVFGFGISPALTGWWLAKMSKEKKKE